MLQIGLAAIAFLLLSFFLRRISARSGSEGTRTSLSKAGAIRLAAALSPVSRDVALALGLLLAGVFGITKWIESPDRRFAAIERMEAYLRYLDGWAQTFSAAALWMLVFLAVLLVVILADSVVIRDRQMARNRARQAVALVRALGLYRGRAFRAQVILAVATSVTFLGVAGGTIRDVADVRLADAQRRVNELTSRVDRQATETAIDLAVAETEVERELDRIVRSFHGVEAIYPERSPTARAVQGEFRRLLLTPSLPEPKPRNTTDVHPPKAPAGGWGLLSDRALNEIDKAILSYPKPEAAIAPKDENWVQPGVEAEIYDSMKELAVELALEPRTSAIVDAFLSDYPIAKPFFDAVIEGMQGIALDAARPFADKPLHALQSGRDGLRRWVERTSERRAKRIQAELERRKPFVEAADLIEADRQRFDKELRRTTDERLRVLRRQAVERHGYQWTDKLPPENSEGSLVSRVRPEAPIENRLDWTAGDWLARSSGSPRALELFVLGGVAQLPQSAMPPEGTFGAAIITSFRNIEKLPLVERLSATEQMENLVGEKGSFVSRASNSHIDSMTDFVQPAERPRDWRRPMEPERLRPLVRRR